MKAASRYRLAALACALGGCALLAAAPVRAASVGALQAKVQAARAEAGALAASLSTEQGELALAERRATAAASRERALAGLLASGRRRSAGLALRVRHSQRRLAVIRGRLQRARAVLARRLVAIYENGTPSTTALALGAGNFNQLANQTEYLREIQGSDSALAERVASVRNSVRQALMEVSTLKAQVDAYDARLALARAQIASVRQGALASAARLHSIATARAASLASLNSSIGSWVDEIELARAAAAQGASRESAEATVGRWLGGPYSIPSYIVMCESGGNYGALNPSSGAGGAYQILSSTWRLYGGRGSPQGASRSEQNSIAAKIWADSGPGAWACGHG